jgi:CheY-like chemotaxis protein
MDKKVWVLLEDDMDIMVIVSAMCQIWDIELIKLYNGHEAMAWIANFKAGKYQGTLPELALLDIRLPGPQGNQVSAAIRQTPNLQNIAIILMSAYRLTREEQQDMIFQSRADLFLNKPLPRLFEFNGLIVDLLEARKTKAKPSTTSLPRLYPD